MEETVSLNKPQTGIYTATAKTELSIFALNFLTIFLLSWSALKLWIGTLTVVHLIVHTSNWTFNYNLVMFILPIALTSFHLRKRKAIRPWLIGLTAPLVLYIIVVSLVS